jgi:hypothetical protein
MNIFVESELEIQREAISVLMKHLPASKVARLISLWRIGSGDYVSERRKLFSGETVESLFAKAYKLKPKVKNHEH